MKKKSQKFHLFERMKKENFALNKGTRPAQNLNRCKCLVLWCTYHQVHILSYIEFRGQN